MKEQKSAVKVQKSPSKEPYKTGVSRELMDRVLALCEGWGDWSAAGGWEEMHDYVSRTNQLQVSRRKEQGVTNYR